jgi:hypothetical protein
MTSEIQQSQLRILELEKQKTSIDYNFNVINDVLAEKKTAINNNRYCKSVPLARYYDQELVTQLEAIYNIIQIVDERLKKLEQSLI